MIRMVEGLQQVSLTCVMLDEPSQFGKGVQFTFDLLKASSNSVRPCHIWSISSSGSPLIDMEAYCKRSE